jgi:hypothetical protein
VFFHLIEKNHWAQWLTLVEWWYNTSYHSTTHMTLFEAVCRQNPPLVLSYMSGFLKVQEVEKILTISEAILRSLKENLSMAHNCTKQQVDQGHFKRQFFEGDKVFLCLQPYKKTSLKLKIVRNLLPNFMVLISFSNKWGLWPTSYLFLVILRSIFFSCLILKECDWN